MKKIGIMGGTFNPIHIGHLLLAQTALERVGLDEVWFIPTGCSYMKSDINIVSARNRFEMVCEAVMDDPKMKCLDIEVKRSGYTYTYETLEELHELYPEFQFYFIFGSDCLFKIENWKCPEKIFGNCSIIAAVRGGASIHEMNGKIHFLHEKYGADICLLPFMNLEISSTMIRERIAKGLSVRYLVPEKTLAYIEKKGFYRDENS